MDDRDESRLLLQLLSQHWQLLTACSPLLPLLLLMAVGVVLLLQCSSSYYWLGSGRQWMWTLWRRLPLSSVYDALMGPISPGPPADVPSGDLLWTGRHAVCVAVQGSRPSMEDCFCSEEVTGLTDSLGEVCLYGVFDGHGGQFAADYCKTHMLSQLKRHLVTAHSTAASVLARLRSAEGTSERSSSSSCSLDDFCEVKSSPGVSGGVSTDELITSRDAETCDETLLVSSDECCSDDTSVAPPGVESVNCAGRQYDAYRSGRRDYSGSVSVLAPGRRATRGNLSCSRLVSRLGRVDYSRLLQLVFAAVDQQLLSAAAVREDGGCVAGSTAVVAMWLRSQRHLVVAGCGDSRAVGCDRSGRVTRLTTDHLPNLVQEKQRVLSAGGSVLLNGVWRVNGSLAVSRAMGDLPFKKQGVITCCPDVTCVDLVTSDPASLQFVLLASDGLWDTVSSEEACQRVLRGLHEPLAAVRALVRLSLLRGSKDNVTVMLVDLRNRS